MRRERDIYVRATTMAPPPWPALLTLLLTTATAQHMHNALFRPLAYNSPCWALLSDAGDAGCRSPQGGLDGIITTIRSMQDVQSLSDHSDKRWAALIDSDVLSR